MDPVKLCLLGQKVTALLHEGANGKPQTVGETEVVFQVVRVGVARVRVLPFVGCKPRINISHKYVELLSCSDPIREESCLVFIDFYLDDK